MDIKVKQIVPKTERSRLPGRVDRDYPKDLPAVFLSTQILDQLKEYAASDLSYELGGVLAGRAAKASSRMFVEILGFVPARKGISRRASFEFTNEAQAQIHEDMEKDFPKLKTVGWFHTHPGYGVFLSSADQFIDQHYFREPYHIAMVFDPTKPDVDVGVFVWNSDQKRIRVPCYDI